MQSSVAVTRTKLATWCDSVIEAGWLAALVVTPLFFNIHSSFVFEPDKTNLVQTLALLMLGAWLTKIASGAVSWRSGSLRAWWRMPFALPVALMVLALVVSTLVSVAPHISWWGSPNRLRGAYPILCCVVIAVLAAAHLRRPEQFARLSHAIVVTSLPVAIGAVLQHHGLDPLAAGLGTENRVAANAGNPIFLGAYLIMALPLTVVRLCDAVTRCRRAADAADSTAARRAGLAAGASVIVLVMQLLAIYWSQSRGPVLGLLVGGYLFVLLALTVLRPRRVRHFVLGFTITGLVASVLLVALNTSPAFEPLRNSQSLGRYARLLDTKSNSSQVRVLIWQGAAATYRPHPPLTLPGDKIDSLNSWRPLTGYGPETLALAFAPFYPPPLAHLEARNSIPDRAHNASWDALITTGAFGFLASLALFVSIFYCSLRWLGLIRSAFDNGLFAALLGGGGVAAGLTAWLLNDLQWQFVGVALPAGIVAGLLCYASIAAYRCVSDDAAGEDRPRQLLILALLAAIVAHYVETQVGIPTVTTLVYFGVETALLLCIGLRWLSLPAASVSQPGRNVPPAVASAIATETPPTTRVVTTPIDVLIFMIFVFIYTYNGRGLAAAPAVLWASISGRTASGDQLGFAAILVLMLLTWGVAFVLGPGQRRASPRAALRHAAIVWGVWLAYGLLQGNRLIDGAGGRDLGAYLEHSAGHFSIFTWLLVGWCAIAGASFAWPALRRPLPFARRPLPGAVAGAALAAGLYAVVAYVHIDQVQADIFFKQGKHLHSQRDWAGSGALFRRASLARTSNDHYLLFLGRSLLRQVGDARDEPASGAAPTVEEVLSGSVADADRPGRFALLLMAEAVLTRARELNPLNTLTTSFLARLHSTRASMTADPAQRRRHFTRSFDEYALAVAQAPNSAHLWNEMGNVYLAAGEEERARQAFEHSLAIDPLFDATLQLLARVHLDRKSYQAALDVLVPGIATLENSPRHNPPLPLLELLSLTHIRLNNLEQSNEASEKILATYPDNVSALLRLAVLSGRLGQHDRAAEWARRGLSIAERDGDRRAANFRQLLNDIDRRSDDP